MNDRRVQRGNTYAAMIIPAGSYPDSFNAASNKENKPTLATRVSPALVTSLQVHKNSRQVFQYPNRDIPSPEPVMNRAHLAIQTEEFVEHLTDKPFSTEQGVATEFYLDRPPVPLFQPLMPPKPNCKATQIYDGDHELFDFDKEVEPMLNVLVEKSLEQAQMEVLEEHELVLIKQQSEEYQQLRNAELIQAQRFEAAEQRVAEEIYRRRT